MANVVGLLKRRGCEKTVDALVTTEGVRMSADHPRAPRVPPCIALLHAALIAVGAFPAWVGHGARWLLVGSGSSPLFIERAGAASGGGIILWGPSTGDATEREGVMRALATVGARVVALNIAKGAGYRATLPVDATRDEVQALVAYATAHARMGGGDGYRDVPGAGHVIPTPDDVPSSAPAVGPEAPTRRKVKRAEAS